MTSPNLIDALPLGQECEFCHAKAGEACKSDCPAGGNLAQASAGNELVVNERCSWCLQPCTNGTHENYRQCFREFKATLMMMAETVNLLEKIALGEEIKEEEDA